MQQIVKWVSITIGAAAILAFIPGNMIIVNAMIQLGWCGKDDALCQLGYLGVILLVLWVSVVTIGALVHYRDAIHKTFVYYAWEPRRTNLKLFRSPIRANEITLKVCNREWRYLSESIVVSVEYREKERQSSGGYPVHVGTLRWTSDLSSRVRKIRLLSCDSVEFVKINPETERFHVPCHENNVSVDGLAFGVGDYQFTVHLTGDVFDRRGLRRYRVTSRYDVMVSYSGDGQISADVRDVNASYPSSIQQFELDRFTT